MRRACNIGHESLLPPPAMLASHRKSWLQGGKRNLGLVAWSSDFGLDVTGVSNGLSPRGTARSSTRRGKE